MNLPAYSAYKAADVEWADSLPVSWKLVPVKRVIARVESGTSVNAADVPGLPGEIAVLKTSCVYSGEFLPSENKTVYDSAEMARVTCPLRSETLIVSRMNTPDLVGAAGYVRNSVEDIYLPDRLWQITFNEDADPRWVHYWTKTPSYRDQLKAICVGTSSSMQNISQADFGSLVLALPSRHEQAAIADLLDRETAKIDALIAKQERLIAALREDRTATITHAVTKGLDPDVETKDSAIQGLGPIPVSWSVTPLLRCVEGRVDYRGATPKKADDGVLLITARNVRPGWIDYEISDEYVSAEDYGEIMRRGLPEIDDLLFTMEAPLGNAALVDRTDIALAQRIIKFRPNAQIVLPRYLLYSVIGEWFQSQLVARATGSTALGLKASKLPELRVAVPDMNEQSRIVEFLDERWTKIDELVAKAAEVVETLREYRSALITDAVTGKIDVRRVA